MATTPATAPRMASCRPRLDRSWLQMSSEATGIMAQATSFTMKLIPSRSSDRTSVNRLASRSMVRA
jgi:hypothetical protein